MNSIPVNDDPSPPRDDISSFKASTVYTRLMLATANALNKIDCVVCTVLVVTTYIQRPFANVALLINFFDILGLNRAH